MGNFTHLNGNFVVNDDKFCKTCCVVGEPAEACPSCDGCQSSYLITLGGQSWDSGGFSWTMSGSVVVEDTGAGCVWISTSTPDITVTKDGAPYSTPALATTFRCNAASFFPDVFWVFTIAAPGCQFVARVPTYAVHDCPPTGDYPYYGHTGGTNVVGGTYTVT